MPVLFAATLFLSATLLFLIQPMIAKMLMPLAGGTSAVWSTCMVFFQTMLLGGYWYAHAGSTKIGPKRFARPHALLLLLPIAALAIAAWWGSPLTPIKSLAPRGQEYPFFNLVILLAALVGLPFFFLATSAPLLQRWFAETDSPSANDPYFLYAASNLGSLLGLIAYPALIERYLPLSQQAWLFAAGFAVWAFMTWLCASAIAGTQERQPQQKAAVGEAIPLLTRLHWLVLAAVPSSLMLSVTTTATVDLAPIPLFIVIPLGLYLLTFVIAFGRPGEWLGRFTSLAAPVAILLLVFIKVSDTKPKNLAWALAIHVGVFFITALACHLELSRRRPPAGRLTEFYLWVSLGGVVGGLFNALLAPIIFHEHTEYIIGLIAACFLVPRGKDDDSPSKMLLDLAMPVLIGCAVFLLLRFWSFPETAGYSFKPILEWPPIRKLHEWLNNDRIAVSYDALKAMLCYGVPILVCFVFVERPLRFGLCVAAVFLASELNINDSDVLLRTRSFFGALKIVQVPDKPAPEANVYYKLVHGTTLHGMQRVDPPSGDPMTYYHRMGPCGDIFTSTPSGKDNKPIAFIGLGTGSLCAYAKPGQKVAIYEIDPAIRRIATNPKYFSYTSEAEKRGADLSFVMGDARLRIEEAPNAAYQLIVVDAFSSDSIPIHLLSKEAVQLYFSKLAPDGVLAMHVSNRFLSLDEIVARIAQDLGKHAYHWKDRDEIADGACPIKSRSDWFVLVNRPEDAGQLLKLTAGDGKTLRWISPEVDMKTPLWTDDFSNILSVMTWGD